MAVGIRLAEASDADQMLEIYAPVVRDTAISFELTAPTKSEFRERIQNTLRQRPWLVYESDGRILGYAYAGPFRTREAYQWAGEVTVYVDATSHRGGVGRALYASLLECLRLQGYCRAIAVITLPNPASVGLHEHIGFRSVGVLNDIGYKLGKWHDVGWWQLDLQESVPSPSEPKPVTELVGSEAWNDALSKGVADLRA
ncbi:MAG: GNAT family N-acetyltransferase [Chloroflexi bacterium]|nr:GNAT family N-acetyltransferase [Chloroflexota bacterium]MDA1227170.1 GNAT family N-acetyltransferase [Chloroflexota bacterium]